METETYLSSTGSSPLVSDWKSIDEEYVRLEASHSNYRKQLEELYKAQLQHSAAIRNYKKLMSGFESKMHRDSNSIATSNSLKSLTAEIRERRIKLEDMNEQLPRDNNGLYLRIILGRIDISLTNKNDKFRYKDDYEKFKMTVTFVCMVVASLALCFHFRVLDALFHFLLVWYYCTLTIRESILRCNGSRIKGWWLAHHYFSAILCGILLTWPDGDCYQSFRQQFLRFSLYLTMVQLIQCQYQRGCLYRLRSLGDSHSMAITIDGFHSWMFRGLTFVLPFLCIGYAAQLYNAYTLYNIWFESSCAVQWQVLAASGLFLFLSVGNTLTTMSVCYKKLVELKFVDYNWRLLAKYSVENGVDAKNVGKKDKDQ